MEGYSSQYIWRTWTKIKSLNIWSLHLIYIITFSQLFKKLFFNLLFLVLLCIKVIYFFGFMIWNVTRSSIRYTLKSVEENNSFVRLQHVFIFHSTLQNCLWKSHFKKKSNVFSIVTYSKRLVCFHIEIMHNQRTIESH